jgi:hypothetical protein
MHACISIVEYNQVNVHPLAAFRCLETFECHAYPRQLAGDFFLDLSAKLEHELFAREQAMLLSMALEVGAGDICHRFKDDFIIHPCLSVCSS